MELTTMHTLAERLELTEDEAYALLTLAMTAEIEMEPVAVQAVAKLAEYCKSYHSHQQPEAV